MRAEMSSSSVSSPIMSFVNVKADIDAFVGALCEVCSPWHRCTLEVSSADRPRVLLVLIDLE